MKKYLIIAGLIGISVYQTGCRKTLDVNKNPNSLENVGSKQLLSSAEVSIAQAYGNYFQIVGGIWGQYWTQNPVASQYKPLDQYSPGPSTGNNVWTLLYAGALTDLQKIIDKNESKNYLAVAMMLQAYTYQLLTDNFGDIPYSEAIKGEQGILNPKYDAQEAIYTALIAKVQAAEALLDDNIQVPENDILYGGDLSLWAKFGNTLLLRMYLRLAYAKPAFAQQGIRALEASGAEFLDEGESAQVAYSTEAGNTNPLYSESHTIGNQNLVASATALDSFRLRDDPRIDVFYFNNGTGYRGLRQGKYDTSTTITWAYPGAAVGGIANPTTAQEAETKAAPVKLLSSYESQFLQAEAIARGWLMGDAAATLEYAIDLNFTEWGVDPDSAYKANTGFPTGGTPEQMIKIIITEKYYAMAGNQNIEAWTEWRRTGYPSFFKISAAPGAGSIFPARLPYPETEITRNLNFPGQRSVFDKVYWDKN